MLDVLMSQIVLQCPGIVPIIRKLVATGMSEHMRMDGKRQLCYLTSPADHLSYCGISQGSTTLSSKEIGGRLLLSI
jgi:hypothetical protein